MQLIPLMKYADFYDYSLRSNIPVLSVSPSAASLIFLSAIAAALSAMAAALSAMAAALSAIAAAALSALCCLSNSLRCLSSATYTRYKLQPTSPKIVQFIFLIDFI